MAPFAVTPVALGAALLLAAHLGLAVAAPPAQQHDWDGRLDATSAAPGGGGRKLQQLSCAWVAMATEPQAGHRAGRGRDGQAAACVELQASDPRQPANLSGPALGGRNPKEAVCRGILP
jgi:hypothetical protein